MRKFSANSNPDDGRKKRFFIAARGLDRFVTTPTIDELTELENAARALEASQAPDRAAHLHSLRDKIGASLRDDDRRVLSRNVEDQIRAETIACQVGPRPMSDHSVLSALREALLAGRVVRFNYGGDDGEPPRWRKVVPYGLLFGPRYYLVASVKSRPGPVLFRLDMIHDVKVTEESGSPPDDFKLKAFAERSFGVFQEEPEDVELRFAPSAARDARAYLFHPTQSFADEPDGSLTVRFHAGGLKQIVHHLMTWGTAVTIVAPPALQELMREQVEALHATLCSVSAVGRFETSSIDAKFEQIVIAKHPDDQCQRFLKIGARGGVFAGIEHRSWQNGGHDGRLAIVGKFPIFEAGFPHHELDLGKNIILVQTFGKFRQHPLVGFRRIVGLRRVRKANCRKISVGFVVFHSRSAMIDATKRLSPRQTTETDAWQRTLLPLSVFSG